MSNLHAFSIYKTTIEQVMTGQERLPSLPHITLRVRRAAASEHTTITQMSELIGHDPSLTVVVMHHSCSPLFKTRQEAKSLDDAIRLMGIPYVVNVVMIHSLKSLFIVQNPKLKALFAISWKRQALKASMSRFFALKFGHANPDEVFISSLFSEVGTLAILSALSESKETPDQLTYLKLCRHYSKSLATIILKKWAMDERYVTVARGCGDWSLKQESIPQPLSTLDIVNLAIYHSTCLLKRDHKLPPLETLALYQRLPKSLNQRGKNGLLQLLNQNLKDVVDAARALN